MTLDRGGIPRTYRLPVPTTGRFKQFEALSGSVRILSPGALHVYFKEADFTGDTNYVVVAAGEVWSAPMRERGIWMKSASGTVTVELTVFHN